MRRYFLFFLLMCCLQAIANDHFKQSNIKVRQIPFRDVPNYEFVTPPTDLMINYYDYMPGSYNSTPVRVQPDQFGGVYLVFHARETIDANRRIYYAYIDAAGNISAVEPIDTTDITEGYPGIDIDPVTGDPFVSWHSNADPLTASLACSATYAFYHSGNPCQWREPFLVIPNNPGDDEFIWPYVHIGPSPEPEKRRVYVQARNAFSSTDPSENPIICYADFNEDDFNMQSTLDWHYITLPRFNYWNQGIPEWIRPFHSFDVSKTTGLIAFFGYNSNNEIYICYNDNYGEGDWRYDSFLIEPEQQNPQNLDGTYVFTDDEGNPYDLYWSFIFGDHMQSVFVNDNSIIMSVPLGLQYDELGSPYFYDCLIYPYVFQYDFYNNQFSHQIQAPQINQNASNPLYNWQTDQIYCPWDTDNDGEIDEYDDEGNVIMFKGWPIYNWNTDYANSENNMKIAVNEDNGWIINIWQDGLKSKLYNDLGDPNYIDWENISEIFITASCDHGNTWSDPIIMNAKEDDENFVPELQDMMPCYLYAGDKIVDLGNGWGEVHLMFLDDYTFGMGNSAGMMKYASIKIDFSSVPAPAKDPVVTVQDYTLQNYPNPFNPSTEIGFQISEFSETETIEIEIFNVKGQKIKSFAVIQSGYPGHSITETGVEGSASKHSVIWYGKDENDQPVSSGVYFYRLKVNGKVRDTNKMLLLK